MTTTVSPSAYTPRMVTGRNGSPPANRAPNGASTWSTNCCVPRYSLATAECPSIRQTMPGANTSVIGPVPWRQASKAWRMISRLVSVCAIWLLRPGSAKLFHQLVRLDLTDLDELVLQVTPLSRDEGRATRPHEICSECFVTLAATLEISTPEQARGMLTAA